MTESSLKQAVVKVIAIRNEKSASALLHASDEASRDCHQGVENGDACYEDWDENRNAGRQYRAVAQTEAGQTKPKRRRTAVAEIDACGIQVERQESNERAD